MSVKTIFKTLIGTIVVIVMTSVIVEMFNINISGMIINQYTKTAARQSCVLFTQETYRNISSSGNTGAVNEYPIYASDGTEYSYLGGSYRMNEFYSGTTESDIWNSLYVADSSNFKNELQNIMNAVQTSTSISNASDIDGELAKKFPELASLKKMADYSGATIPLPYTLTPEEMWDLPEDNYKIVANNNAIRANSFKDNRYTPVNLGIPYMDKTVTKKMFQWHLTQLLSNCNSGAIQLNEGHSTGSTNPYAYYVDFKGFKVFTRAAQITNYTYYVFELDKIVDPSTGGILDEGKRQQFKNMTGMNISDLSYDNSTNNKISNNTVFVVEIDYEVPVTYVGITPLNKIFDYFFNRGTVIGEGYDGVATTQTAVTYNETPEMLTEHDASSKVSTGKLYYTLVR